MCCEGHPSKLPLYVFVHISIGLSYFFLLTCESFHKNKISPFSYAFLITFSHGGHSCSDFNFLFWLKDLIFMSSNLSVSLLQLPNFVSCLEGFYYSNILMFYSTAFMILLFMLQCLIHLKFILVYEWGRDLTLVLQILSQFIEHCLLNNPFLPHLFEPYLYHVLNLHIFWLLLSYSSVFS